MQTPTDEWLDLVDENDQVTGRMLRSEVYKLGLHNFRSVNLLLVNSQGQLWIPKRALNKRVAPGGLDLSVGGHVTSGDTYIDTLIREAKEELDLDLDKNKLKFLGKLTPYVHSTSSFQEVYELQSDKTPDYNKEDFIDCYWLYPQDILELLEKGTPAKIDLRPIIETFYPSSP